jgi:hypothetical protein
MLAPLAAPNPATEYRVKVDATGVPAGVEREVGLAVISTTPLAETTWKATAEDEIAL